MGNFVHEIGKLTCSALDPVRIFILCVVKGVTAVGIAASGALVIAIFAIFSGSLLAGLRLPRASTRVRISFRKRVPRSERALWLAHRCKQQMRRVPASRSQQRRFDHLCTSELDHNIPRENVPYVACRSEKIGTQFR